MPARGAVTLFHVRGIRIGIDYSWFFVVFLIIIWAVSDTLNAGQFSILMTVLTSFYILSRGIAKASRVLEQ